ncbi:hypothetical protein D3C75_272810 [compost metagenome]
MLRHGNAVVFQSGQRSGGHAIIVGKDGGQLQVTSEQFNHCCLPSRHIRRSGANPAVSGRNSGFFQSILPPFPAHIVIFNMMAGRQIADALMAVIEQHTRRHHRPADVIQRHAAMGVARHHTVDEHHPGDLIHKPSQLLIAERF